MYIEGANYLRNQEVSLMPRRLLCPGFNGRSTSREKSMVSVMLLDSFSFSLESNMPNYGKALDLRDFDR